jgi:hypothetical protein
MIRVASVCAGLFLLSACPPGAGVCEPGATRCADGGGIDFCECGARGGELNAGCREPAHWEPIVNACGAADQCFSDGANATVCIPENLGACTTPHPDEYCVDGVTVHRCEPFQGISTVNADGTFDGLIAEYTCDPDWVCDDTWDNGEAACVIPGDPP